MARNFNYTKINWQDGTILQPAKVNVQGTEYEVESAVISGQTPLNSTNLDHMDEAIEEIIEEELPNVINVELLAIEDTAPSECSTGDKYYNTTDKKIYTATGENTWSSTGEDPLDGILYVLFDKRNTFAWDGTDLISVGGGGGVYIGTTPPEDDNVNYWINPDDNAPYPDFAEMNVDNLTIGNIESKNLNVNNNTTQFGSVYRNNNQRYSFLKAGTYTVSFEITGTASTYYPLLYILDTSRNLITSNSIIGETGQTYDSNLYGFHSSGNKTEETFTLTSDCYVQAVVYYGSAETGFSYNNMQIEKGNTATPYTPYIAFNNNPYVLWTNDAISSTFAGQTVTLSDSITNYKYYEIISKLNPNTNISVSTGRMPISLLARQQLTTSQIWVRDISSLSGTSITFSDCVYYATYGGNTTTNNSVLIPYQILGYK